jgi:hypothetical protein
MSVTRLLAVPPGQQATRMVPEKKKLMIVTSNIFSQLFIKYS